MHVATCRGTLTIFNQISWQFDVMRVKFVIKSWLQNYQIIPLGGRRVPIKKPSWPSSSHDRPRSVRRPPSRRDAHTGRLDASHCTGDANRRRRRGFNLAAAWAPSGVEQHAEFWCLRREIGRLMTNWKNCFRDGGSKWRSLSSY